MANSTDILEQKKLFFIREYQILGLFIFHLWLCIVLFGIVSNTVNITVFLKIGFRDNVTVSLLFLSLSDLFNLILSCPYVVKLVMDQVAPNYPWPLDAFVLNFAFYWYAYTFYDYSSFISVFLGLVRCACVARPLQFKSMFTATRTLVVLAVMFVAAWALRIPVLSIYSIVWDVNPETNATWLTLRVATNLDEINAVNDIINRNIVCWLAYVITVACVIILVTKLQAASKFRQSLASQTVDQRQTRNHNTTPSYGNHGDTDGSKSRKSALQDTTKPPRSSINQDDKFLNKDSKNFKNQNDKSSSTKMSSKDLQVILSVTLICAIFILSQLPFQALSTIRLFDTEFDYARSKTYAFLFTSYIANAFKFSNASVNIFVHYNFNSRYRKTFLRLFWNKSE